MTSAARWNKRQHDIGDQFTFPVIIQVGGLVCGAVYAVLCGGMCGGGVCGAVCTVW